MSKLRSIQKLEEMPPYEIAMLIRNEHPQIIAQIIYHTTEKISSEVITYFTERLRNDVMLRVSTLSDIDKYWLLRLDESLLHTLNNNTSNTVYQKGLEKSADLLKQCDPSYQISVLSAIMEYDPDLHMNIQNQMMLFDDIFDLSVEDLTTLVSVVDPEEFAIALKGFEQRRVNKLIHSLPESVATVLSNKITELSHSKHRITHIVAMRSETLKCLRNLIDEDKITSVNNDWI